jgi:hypothetical protein
LRKPLFSFFGWGIGGVRKEPIASALLDKKES